MNRREFMTLFGFAATVLMLPAAVLREAPQDYQPSPPRPYDGPAYIAAFTASGIGHSSRVAQVGLRRAKSDYNLLVYYLNELGGNVQWVPPPHECVFLTPRQEIELWCNSRNVRADALIRLPGVQKFRVVSLTGIEEITL